ncbi:MAG: hypothetical protein V4526_01695 [Patescibacteria group bacterium]
MTTLEEIPDSTVSIKVEDAQFIIGLGERLRKAMDSSSPHATHEEIAPPTHRMYVELLGKSPWLALNSKGEELVISNNLEYARDGWAGLYEHFYPNLLDNSTFGAWMNLLPQPVSLRFDDSAGTMAAIISWNGHEPRVHQSEKMIRYRIPAVQCCSRAILGRWEWARAEVYVKAWEHMTSFTPAK